MRWWIRHWYEAGLLPGAAALLILVFRWNAFSVPARISLINFAGLMIHQFEEYGVPGGAPVFLNRYVRGGDERYPLNQFSAMLVNVVIGYVSYLLPVFFPDIMWLGMGPILFGCVFQVVLHLGFFGIRFHRFYNPGLAAVLCIHVPCGIFYIAYAVDHSLLSGRDWLFSILYLLGMAAFTGIAGQVVFSSRDSKYPFDEKEIAAGERLAARMGLKS